MTVKNKKLIITFGLVAVITAALAISFFAYRFGSMSKNQHADCETIISQVLAKSSTDPLYEPPKDYFDCIDRS